MMDEFAYSMWCKWRTLADLQSVALGPCLRTYIALSLYRANDVNLPLQSYSLTMGVGRSVSEFMSFLGFLLHSYS